MQITWLILVTAISAGCLRQTEFRCDTNAECGAAGRCEAEGFCSFFDGACSGTQQRFGESAGTFANQCVGGGGSGDDGGVDSPGTNDDGPAGCPSGYDPLAGAPGHLYKRVIVGDNWSGQHNSCVATAPGRAYLAIPDDAAELQALFTLAGVATSWVGINDLQTENTFVNVKGVPQIFLPWASGEPDDTQGGQDCVAAVSATQIVTEKCNTVFAAICECEP